MPCYRVKLEVDDRQIVAVERDALSVAHSLAGILRELLDRHAVDCPLPRAAERRESRAVDEFGA